MTKQTDLAIKAKKSEPITKLQFSSLQAIFDYYNKRLFNSQLYGCMLNFSRKNKSYGFFAAERWEGDKNQQIHEISLNPEFTKNRKPIEWISTIAHEMVHLWQQDFGKPSRTGYHNKEWAEKMKAIGLQPYCTSDISKEVGQNVSHTIIENGKFAQAFEKMPEEIILPFLCIQEKEKEKKKSKNKTKYYCPECDVNVWGKPDLDIMCNDCEMNFKQEEPEEED